MWRRCGYPFETVDLDAGGNRPLLKGTLVAELAGQREAGFAPCLELDLVFEAGDGVRRFDGKGGPTWPATSTEPA